MLAAAEFRVGRIGNMLAETALKPTDSDGNAVQLATINGPMLRAGLPDALDAISPSLETAIWQYRNHELPLDALWIAVGQGCEGVALFVAHAEAANLEETFVLDGLDHPAVATLEPLCRPLFSYLKDGPLLPETGTWQVDRSRLKEIGLDGLTEVWRRLGVSARPEGDTFYLAVTDPPPREVWS